MPPSAPPRSPIRWGIGDFFWVFLGGLVFATITGAVVLAVTGWDPDPKQRTDAQDAVYTGFVALGHFAAFGGLLWLLARLKGRGVVRDLGLDADRDWGVIVACAFAGLAASVTFGLLVFPITNLVDKRQDLVDQLDNAGGLGLFLLALSAGLLAPVFEEILFRGLFLRALMRRMPAGPAVLVSGSVFGLVHLMDPAAMAAVPALVAVGIVSGWLAVRSGGLARSIAFHFGFNLLTVVITVSS